MRVTILTDRYAPEARAAAYLSRELAEGLAKLGHDVAVIARMPTHFVPEAQSTAPQSVETVAGVKIRRVSAFTASSKIWLRALDQLGVSLKIMVALWTAPKSDVLLVYSPPLLLCMAAAVQKWVRRWPYVLNLHDLYPQAAIDLGILRNPVLIWLSTRLECIAYRNAAQIVVAAPASRRILIDRKQLDDSRVEMVFNYIDTTACAPGHRENAFRKQHGLEGRFVVLYAGLMGLAQDLSAVIQVARSVAGDPDWLFVLAGDGPCASKWAQLSVGLPNVKMVGALSYEHYYQALQAADVCLVALSAAFKGPAVPGKVPTIMAAGRPIVASVPAGNDTREILSSACCGVAVAPGDPEALLSSLTALKQQPLLRDQWGANGAKYALKHFDARTAVQKFERILRQVCLATKPPVAGTVSGPSKQTP